MLKIAILGPESTGKSTLAKELSEYFTSPMIPEYAREYVERLERDYTFEDVCLIAQQQVKEEKYFESGEHSSAEYVFFDTSLIITKVWFSYVYHQIPAFVDQRIKHNFFDFYLLCAPDLPWIKDPVRENEDKREFFFEWYRKEIIATGQPYKIIDGSGITRTQKAINTIISLNN